MMELSPEWEQIVGVILALVSGIVNNLGNVIQKKAMNQYLAKQLNEGSKSNAQKTEEKNNNLEALAAKNDSKFRMKDVLGSKMWLFGFLMQLIVATAFFICAQQYIGPTLTPALGSIGLIVLVFGGLVNEKLTFEEYVGIVMIIVSVVLLAVCGLSIDPSKVDFLEHGFLVRVAIFTAITIGIIVFCQLWAQKKDRWEGSMYATLSGTCIALSNFWISPFSALTGRILTGKHDVPTFEHHHINYVVAFWGIALVLVVWSNVQAIYDRQLAFKVGKVTTMIPITHIPSHLSPPVLYSYCFGLKAPFWYSMPMMVVSIILLLVSSFIFAKREAGSQAKKTKSATKDATEVRRSSLTQRPTPSPRVTSPFMKYSNGKDQ